MLKTSSTTESSLFATQQLVTIKQSVFQLSSGFTIGLVVTFALNPWDKAIYLSVTENRRFLHIDNFRYPYQGVGQSLIQRSISRGLYFPFGMT